MPSYSGRLFGRHSTAEEVAAGLDLSGKLVVVTGGSGGLGKETARVLAKSGAHVIIGGRNEQALLTAKRDIAALAPHAHVSEHPLDLLSLSSVRDFARAINSLGRAVDILICNAGIMAVPFGHALNGIESQLMTNYIGHAVLISLLSPMLRRAGRARVVSLTCSPDELGSIAFDDLNFRTRPYDKWTAYWQSKTGCSLLAAHVSQQMLHSGVTAMTVHPGGVLTALGRYLSAAERGQLETRYRNEYKSVESGAATGVWAATAAELEGRDAAYLQDCKIANVPDLCGDRSNSLRYALDNELAARLWCAAEALLAAPLPL